MPFLKGERLFWFIAVLIGVIFAAIGGGLMGAFMKNSDGIGSPDPW